MEETAPTPSPPTGGPSPNVECFQNYTAPEVFIQGLAGMVNQQDTETIIQSQKYMLQRFEKTNEMLINCNQLSSTRFQNAARDFKKHTTMLQEMKKDIDNIFRRIRNIKAKIAAQYPTAYELAATAQRKEKSQQDDQDDEEEESNFVVNINLPSTPTPSKTLSMVNTTSSSSTGTFDRSASIDIPKPKSSDV